MKTKKIIRYRLGVSRVFPATHPRNGESTYFVKKILNTVRHTGYYASDNEENVDMINKLHTMRANYPLWEKRMKKVQEGEAVIELFYWEGKPYHSKQIVFATLDKDSGVGVQSYHIAEWEDEDGTERAGYCIDNRIIRGFALDYLAKNDGLSLEDFKEWFRNYDLSKEMAIIHFTEFRY